MVSLLLQNRNIHVASIDPVGRLGAKEISDLRLNFPMDGFDRSKQAMSGTAGHSPPADFLNVRQKNGPVRFLQVTELGQDLREEVAVILEHVRITTAHCRQQSPIDSVDHARPVGETRRSPLDLSHSTKKALHIATFHPGVGVDREADGACTRQNPGQSNEITLGNE